MRILRKICSAVLCGAVAVFVICSAAENLSSAQESEAALYAENGETTAVKDVLDELSAQSVAVVETTTGRVLFEKSPDEIAQSGHFTKLMTLLLAAEKIDCGELELGDVTTVSDLANAQQGSQIWLDKGEKITIEELVKSVSIGNANDGCVALAEAVCGSEDKALSAMNARAKALKMGDTHYSDLTGTSPDNTTTAADTAKLCAELAKYKNFTPYLTCWLDTVRQGRAELVNLNRLVRSYKGITGMKAWGSQDSGGCIAASAERGEMSVCVVLFGCSDVESACLEAKKLLDMSFQSYELYTPELPEDLTLECAVKGGESLSVKLKTVGLHPVIIPHGAYRSVSCDFQVAEELQAPFNTKTKAGSLIYKIGDEVILEGDICPENAVNKMNFYCAVKKLLYNLLEI